MVDWALNRKTGSVNLIGWRIKNQESLISSLDHFVLLGVVAISRWLYRSQSLYHMDSINYALGIEHFSPVLHQPHPPGYYLYVKLAQLVHNVLPNPNDSLVAISIAASCVAAALAYQLSYTWFGRPAARWSGILFVLSPLMWFHGTVALIYMLEAAMTALFGYLCCLTLRGRHALLVPAVITFGLTAGIRQSAALFLAPLLLFVLWQVSWRRALCAVVICILTIGAWFLPMLIESGGYVAYFTALNDLWSRVSASSSHHNPLMNGALLLLAYALCFGVAAPLLFVRGLPIKTPLDGWKFIIIWLTPGLLFFLYNLNPMVLGYTLFIFIPLVAILGAKIAALPIIKQKGKGGLFFIMALLVVHAASFFYLPFYISQASVMQKEREIQQIERAVKMIASPEKSLIVGVDASFYGFRHLGYSLPEYQVLSFPEISFSQGLGVFSMQNKRTKIIKTIPTRQYEQFVFYYPGARSMDTYQMLFPNLHVANISNINIDGHEFLLGPASALINIFPGSARAD